MADAFGSPGLTGSVKLLCASHMSVTYKIEPDDLRGVHHYRQE